MITVLLVDDHHLVREAIKSLLELAPTIEVIEEADTGETAIELANTLSPDIILMDLGMPGMGGLAAITQILEQNPKQKIIVFTGYIKDPMPAKLIQAGVKGYLSKGSKLAEMIAAISKVHQGAYYFSSEINDQLALRSISKNKSPFEKLSKREYQVLELIIEGYNVKAIAEKFSIAAKTVNTIRYHIHEKLEVENDVSLILLARRHGIIKDGQQYNVHAL